jgi:hypothetical protein
MPQATIKLQQAPAPAVAFKKPAAPAEGNVLKEGPASEKPNLKETKPSETVLAEDEAESVAGGSVSELPLPLLIAAAVLALAALGIQVWTFIS